MSDEQWTKWVEEEIDLAKETADEYIKTNIEPIADLGNPEKLIGKTYDRWTPQDIQSLRSVYVYDSKPLDKFMMGKEIERMWNRKERIKKLEA